jgi:hypothetical protein
MFDDLNNTTKPEGENKESGKDSNPPKPAVFQPVGVSVSEGQTNKEAPVETKLSEEKKMEAKKELDDIFSDTDENIKPAAFHPKEKVLEPVKTEAPKDNKLHKIVIPVIAVIVVIGLIGGGVWAYYKFIGKIDIPFLNNNDSEIIVEEMIEEEKETEKIPQESEEIIEEEEIIPLPEKPEIIEVEIPEPIASPVDTDKDGLTDQEEIQLGTNINSVDSDRDGLFDREEVKVYKTNPLEQDTDGDTYLDGAEVRGGYNPNGPGKLYEL